MRRGFSRRARREARAYEEKHTEAPNNPAHREKTKQMAPDSN
jgi:hypothetical protein